ncbi:MAG: hypothetical protein WCD20_08340 [Rhodomicrobium sp.]
MHDDCASDFEASADNGGGNVLQRQASAYLDGELQGEELAAFEAFLSENPGWQRVIDTMRRIEEELKDLGADILLEPVPDFLFDALERLPRE